jgi:hypothetical protein
VKSTTARAHRLAAAAGAKVEIRPHRWGKLLVDVSAPLVALALIAGFLLMVRQGVRTVRVWQAEQAAGAMICPERVTLADFGECTAEDCRFRYYTAVSDLEIRNALIEQDRILREACSNVRRRELIRRSPRVTQMANNLT